MCCSGRKKQCCVKYACATSNLTSNKISEPIALGQSECIWQWHICWLLIWQFFNLFAQFKTTTKSRENYVFLYPFSNMAISPQNNDKTVFYTSKLYGLTGMVYNFICKLSLWKCTLITSPHCGCHKHSASCHMIWNASYPLRTHCLIAHRSQALLRGVALILHTTMPQKSWGIAVAWPAVVACCSCLWRPLWLSVLSVMPDPVLVVVLLLYSYRFGFVFKFVLFFKGGGLGCRVGWWGGVLSPPNCISCNLLVVVKIHGLAQWWRKLYITTGPDCDTDVRNIFGILPCKIFCDIASCLLE